MLPSQGSPRLSFFSNDNKRFGFDIDCLINHPAMFHTSDIPRGTFLWLPEPFPGPSRTFVTSSWSVNHPYRLRNGKGGRWRTRIPIVTLAAESASERQHVWWPSSRSSPRRAVRGGVFSRNISHAALLRTCRQTAWANSDLVLTNLKAAERQPGFNSA